MLVTMNIGAAIVIGAALVAGAIAISHRYEMRAHLAGKCTVAIDSTCDRAWLVDQWTGRMQICEFGSKTDALNPVCWYAREEATSLP
jgi:hypothetical protein